MSSAAALCRGHPSGRAPRSSVPEAARRPATEDVGHHRAGLVRREKLPPVAGRGAGLRRQQEPGAELHGLRTEGERGDDPTAVHEDDRDVDAEAVAEIGYEDVVHAASVLVHSSRASASSLASRLQGASRHLS
jgi:hypothetical protein